MLKLHSTLCTGDLENKPPTGQCEFGAPGRDRPQVSSPKAPLPVVKGGPVCASSSSSMPAENNLFGKAGEDSSGKKMCCFWKLYNFKMQRINNLNTSFVAMSFAWPGKHQDC